MPIRNGKGTRETLRLDIIDRAFPRYKNADIIIFNTGHWWTHDKTSLGWAQQSTAWFTEHLQFIHPAFHLQFIPFIVLSIFKMWWYRKDYYQEGNRVYSELDVHDAYRRALNTWAKWVDSNVNPKETTVFFRGYSASHFRYTVLFLNPCSFSMMCYMSSCSLITTSVMQRGSMEFRRQLWQGNWANNEWEVPHTIPNKDEHFGGGAPWDENTSCVPEHNKDDWLQKGGTPFSLSQAEVDRGGEEIAWVIPGLQPLVPSWSPWLLERASLRTYFGETAPYDATIKASVGCSCTWTVVVGRRVA